MMIKNRGIPDGKKNMLTYWEGNFFRGSFVSEIGTVLHIRWGYIGTGNLEVSEKGL